MTDSVGALRVVRVPAEEFGAAALQELRIALNEDTEPVIGLPTGRTPVALYAEMARQRFEFPNEAQLFAIDEYCSAASHPGTNHAFFRQWLPRPPFPAVSLPRYDAADAEAEVAQYCNRLRTAGGLTIALVGIGANGHVAFNEPGSTERSPCRVVQLAKTTQAQVADHWQPEPTQGMTLGMDDILRARQVILLASGPGKAAILSAALTGPETTEVPASFLRRHLRLSVVCDLASASEFRS